MGSNPPVRKILILAANPKNTERVRLDQEIREIRTGLKQAKIRDQFEIVAELAVRPKDLRRSLLEHEPHIVHFSGHGFGHYGLALENETGEAHPATAEALERLFELFKDKIECVLLNACYSEVQAEAIYQHIDYVIGMNQSVGDNAAISFAVGFYDALGAGRSYEDAYKFGCSAIDFEDVQQRLTPVLKKRDQSVPAVPSPPPAPSATHSSTISLENPGGQVSLHSPFYIERPPIETDCYDAIVKPGALIRIKAPRQMGKSSLMTRILDHAEQHGCRQVNLTFQEAEVENFASLDVFLQWFCANVADELGLPDRLADLWQGAVGTSRKCSNYFQRYLLKELDAPLVLGLDEVDQVFQHLQIAKDFFGLLRAWHEKGKNDPVWQTLRLVLVHSKEVYIPLHINQSPFNVGLSQEPGEFSRAQVQDGSQRHGLRLSAAEVEQLMAVVGGHPYLVRVALYELARDRITLSNLLQAALREDGLYGDHLRRHWLNLKEQENADLLAAMRQVLAVNRPVKIDSSAGFKLRSMGLVKIQEDGVVPLCGLYREYFGDRLQAS